MKTPVLLTILALLTLLLYPFYVVYRQLQGEHGAPEKTPAVWGASYENVTHLTDDGLTLRGWWVPNRGEKAVLLMHGFGGNRNGIYTGIFELGAWYWKRGYNVLLPDLRAHGESDGRFVHFGVKERDDMLGWIEKIDPEARYRWTLHGFSMGASTALMMKERDPKRFAYVVADAPWIDFGKLVKQELWKRAGLPSWSFPYVRWIAETFFGQDFREADNRKRVRRLCGAPILYVFEADDRLVPSYQRRILMRECPDADRVLFPDAGHVEAFKNDPEAYTRLLESKGL